MQHSGEERGSLGTDSDDNMRKTSKYFYVLYGLILEVNIFESLIAKHKSSFFFFPKSHFCCIPIPMGVFTQ